MTLLVRLDKEHYHLHDGIQKWCNEYIGQKYVKWNIDWGMFGHVNYKFLNIEDKVRFLDKWLPIKDNLTDQVQCLK